MRACLVLFVIGIGPAEAADEPPHRTLVAIDGDRFLIDGKPTYAGRAWEGHRIEGLLLNSRMVQATFDDRNPETRERWAYPDTGRWDPERNTAEFLAALPSYRKHGLLAVTINVQGGSPRGYSREQPWHNSGFEADGTLHPATLARLGRVLDRLDELGMVAILGIFYFGQDERLRDEAAVIRGVDAVLGWLDGRGDTHVLIEVNNECDVRYDHEILRPGRVHELIGRVRDHRRPGGLPRYLVGTSYGGGTIPGKQVAGASDFLLIHGNGVEDPDRIVAMVRQSRDVAGRTLPILFNEDDHYGFDRPRNNFRAAIESGASWGFFDFRRTGEAYAEGFQSVPVDWGITSDRKRGFFGMLRAVTGVD